MLRKFHLLRAVLLDTKNGTEDR